MRVMPRQALIVILLLCTFFSGNGYAQKNVVKADKVYEPNKKIILKSSYESKNATYEWDIVYLPKGGFPTPLTDDQYEEVGSTLYVWGGEGSYMATVRATDFEAKKVEKTKFTFIIGKPKPPDPPDPPNPPDPPVPVDDEFTKGCKQAFTDEVGTLTGAARKNIVDKISTLGLVYKTAAKTDTGIALVDNPSLKTALQLNNALHETIKIYMTDDELPKFRKGILQAYMKSNLPSAANTPLTDDIRKKFKDTYTKIGTTLQAIAK